MNFPKVNLYQKLGLSDFASSEEVKKRYHKLILIHHPDRGGKLEEAQALNAIYEILSKHKTEYDEFLRQLLNPIPVFTKIIIRTEWTYGTDVTASDTATSQWW